MKKPISISLLLLSTIILVSSCKKKEEQTPLASDIRTILQTKNTAGEITGEFEYGEDIIFSLTEFNTSNQSFEFIGEQCFGKGVKVYLANGNYVGEPIDGEVNCALDLKISELLPLESQEYQVSWPYNESSEFLPVGQYTVYYQSKIALWGASEKNEHIDDLSHSFRVN